MKVYLSIILFFSCSFIFANEGKSISSNLHTVTIYRNGAEMIHHASTYLAAGNNELMIEGISNNVDVNSIQISCPAAVTIMSVEFSNNYLVRSEEATRIRILKDSAEDIQHELEKIVVSINTTTDLLEVLKANRDIKGAQTGLSVTELAKLMDYYKTKSVELQNELASLREKQKKLNAHLVRIRQQIAEEEKKNTRSGGRIFLQLSVALAGKNDFTISYITPNAHWTPYYDIRVDDIKSPLKVIYKAKLVQTTGIDWKQVKLSLSTSVPNQWGNAPVLRSWFLSYINPVVAMERGLATNRIQSFDTELKEVVVSGYGTLAPAAVGSRKPLIVVNGAIMSEEEFAKIRSTAIAKTEMLNDASATAMYGSRGNNGVMLVTLKDGLGDYVSVTDNELNVSFDIALPYDVPTNGKEQTATLKEFGTDAIFKYYSVPRLDKDAYLVAEVSDWEKLNLLPGNANIIFEGTYVGKSFIDPNSTSDTLNLTLGRDKRAVVKREKLADFSSVKFLGNMKLQKLTYQLTVKNNKKDTVRMLLKDQFPLSTNKDIEVELIDGGGADVNQELGILNWKLELKPAETRTLRFTYTVRYPKDKALNLN